MHLRVKRLDRGALPACDAAAPASGSADLPARTNEDLHVEWLNASIAGSTEGARTVGALAVNSCAPASLGHEYPSVRRRVWPLLARLAMIDQRPASLRAEQIQLLARLDDLPVKGQAPLRERERSGVTQTPAHERGFACQSKTGLQLRRQRPCRASRAVAVHSHDFHGRPVGQRPLSQTDKERFS